MTFNKLNISIKQKISTKKRTQRTQRKQRTQINPKNQYPLYKNEYKLNISRIANIIKNMKNQLYTFNNAPTTYKGYPAHKFKTLDINNANANANGLKENANGNNVDTHIKNKKQYYIIKSAWNDNLELNSLTDYFSEPCRIKCNFKYNPSPLEYWNKNWQSILASLKKKHQSPTYHNLHEALYLHNKACNNFRISVCLEVLKIFKPKKWLDISAGWGDRLLSALLYAQIDAQTDKQFQMYCGVDPNPCLHPYYKEMIKTFDPLGQKEYILLQDGFETAKLPNTKFDLVLSSPPFFDLEIYSKAISNSLVKYKSEDSWFNGFLMPSLYKANDYLELGGYLVLYMGESQGTKYIPKMVELMNAKMHNAGMLYYTDGAKIREFFCWKK